MKLKPVIPFEPILSEEIPDGPQWVAQVKWDGVRVLAYYDGLEVLLFNRKLHERTMQFPELTQLKSYCSASSVVLDGEVIALQNGKPSFHQVMKRDGVRNPKNVERAKKTTPVIYMLFDILYCNEKWVNEQPLRERQELLAEVITPGENVQLVENFSDACSLFAAIQTQGLEGIVCKDLNSTYAFGKKDGRWQKVKNYKDLTAVIGGVTLRGATVNAVLLGIYDNKGQLWYIGHAGTGKLTSADWKALTEKIKPLVVPKRPFINKPERVERAIWLKPVITAKIQFLEWTEGHTLRQPSIQGFVEVPPEECIVESPFL